MPSPVIDAHCHLVSGSWMPDRVLFGADGPSVRPLLEDDAYLRLIRSLPESSPGNDVFTTDEIDALLGGNAARLIGE